MRPVHTHTWEVSPAEAMTIQKDLLGRLSTQRFRGTVNSVAGIDVAVVGGQSRAAAVVLSYPELEPLCQVVAERPVQFPYVPGLLTFREGPVILDALAKLAVEPDLMIFDGQGIAHPRFLGLASHMGILLDQPSIGCAKSRLCGEYDQPGPNRGDFSSLFYQGELVGAVLRTRPNVSPVFVSVGHRIDLGGAIQYVLGCCRRYRLPETTRWAHRAAGRALGHGGV